jgi:hypothetical protein
VVRPAHVLHVPPLASLPQSVSSPAASKIPAAAFPPCRLTNRWHRRRRPPSHSVSSLAVFNAVDADYVISSNWKARPRPVPAELGPHLAEFVCREFAHAGVISVAIARVGEHAGPRVWWGGGGGKVGKAG